MPPLCAPPSYTLAAHRVQINQFANGPGFISPQFLCGFMVRLKFSAGQASPPLQPRRGSNQVPCGTERCVHPCCVNGQELPAALRQGRKMSSRGADGALGQQQAIDLVNHVLQQTTRSELCD